MYKKLIAFSIIVLGTVSVQAQVVATVQVPPLGLTIKPQLWNLSLINTDNEAINVRIEMVMTDIANNQLVLTGTSRLIVLPRGVRQILPGDVMPITYQVGNAGYPADTSPDGFLPIGTFNICYHVIKVNNDAPEQLTEECVTLEVEPISPPQLIIPLDEERTDLSRPLFAWAPPAPVQNFSSMLYDWILVEVQPTQSAADAVQQNIPVYTQQNVQFTSLQYPLSMPELDTSRLYAWRIIAKQNASPIANSEIWTFRVNSTESRPVQPGTDYFARLYREENAAFIVCPGILRFEYRQDNNSPEAEIRIVDLSTNTRKPVNIETPVHAVKYGDNFIQIDLRNHAQMTDRHMYLLELRNARSEKWYLKFEYRNNPGEE